MVGLRPITQTTSPLATTTLAAGIGELADGFGMQALLDLAATLAGATGSDAELAKSIAAGIKEMAQAEKTAIKF